MSSELTDLKHIEQNLQGVMLKDRFSFKKTIQRIKKSADNAQTSQIEKLQAKYQRSRSLAQKRQQNLPPIQFDHNLPIVKKLDTIKAAIEENQLVVIAGETGSGKTTQIPKLCLEMGRGVYGFIGHTQPRRIAARSVARRIAEELDSPPGAVVGYKVRFNDQLQESSLVKLMTDGILLAEIQSDRFLQQYDTLIIDEAHERSLNIDFILGFLKNLLPRRPDLKVIITSATIDHQKFAEHFNHAPIIEVSGRTFPVEDRYRPIVVDADKNNPQESSLEHAVVGAIEECIENDLQHSSNQPGDILLFCSGEGEIRQLSKLIRQRRFTHTEVLPLYARLSARDQEIIFKPHRGRRIVLSTNVAETSLTVPNIRYVIDLGKARISRYSYRQKFQRLPIEAISRASANQRRGRCGRVENGVCIRLYSQQDYLSRPEFTEPELLRTNLASVILQMALLRLGDIAHFPFINPPDERLINDGYRLLQELQAVDKNRSLTSIGRAMASLPTDPRFARMLIEANKLGCLDEVLVIVSGLSIQDARERPVEHQQAADEKHRQFQDKKSDFLALLKLWQAYEQQRQTLSANQLKKYCKNNFLSYMRMREWREVHYQLKLCCDTLGYRLNKSPAGYDNIHIAILSGLLSHIASQDEDHLFKGARNNKLHIFPGSALAKKPPQWIMAAEIVETSKVYARTVAKIEPNWLLPLAPHLIKKSYSEPAWQRNRGQVMAKQVSVLYGLVVEGDKKVPYHTIEPDLCRELFIQSALVEGQIRSQGNFLEHNQKLIDEVAELENKSRRRDLLASDQVLFDFYEQKIPSHINSTHRFERWRKKQELEAAKYLYIDAERLLQNDPSKITEQQFPNYFEHEGVRYPLRYEFSPGAEYDGITLTTPVALVQQLPLLKLQWLVPGLLKEKCVALVKALPKKWRRNFTPVADCIDKIMPTLQVGETSLSHAIGLALKELTNIEIPEQVWSESAVEDYYSFVIEIIDEQGQVLAKDRDLLSLKAQFSDYAVQSPEPQEKLPFERQGVRQWDFDDLEQFYQANRYGVDVRYYPAIVDRGDHVDIKALESSAGAEKESLFGCCRLIELRLNQQVRQLKKLAQQNSNLFVRYRDLGDKSEFIREFVDSAIVHVFQLDQSIPYCKAGFESRVDQGRDKLLGHGQGLLDLLDEILISYAQLSKKLNGKISLVQAPTYQDINRQLQQLIYPGFIVATPWPWLQQFPRYLKAMEMRLEKLAGQMEKDRLLRLELEKYNTRYRERQKINDNAGIVDPELDLFRWMLEEYKVSLFAQTLKTKMPISSKRLDKQWQKLIK